MKRKYIDNLGIKFEDTPQGWCLDDKNRKERWESQRSVYGFDDRETWNLDYTISLFLYERLMMYKEINVVDMNYHKFDIDGREMTFEECIDVVLEGLRTELTTDKYGLEVLSDEYIEMSRKWKLILMEIYNYLWW